MTESFCWQDSEALDAGTKSTVCAVSRTPKRILHSPLHADEHALTTVFDLYPRMCIIIGLLLHARNVCMRFFNAETHEWCENMCGCVCLCVKYTNARTQKLTCTCSTRKSSINQWEHTHTHRLSAEARTRSLPLQAATHHKRSMSARYVSLSPSLSLSLFRSNIVPYAQHSHARRESFFK